MSIFVPFLGVVNVPIKTLTSSYSSVSGSLWNFSTSNPTPLDFGAWGASGTTTQGFKANIISRANITSVQAGVFTGSRNSIYGDCGYFGTTLAVVGILPNGTGQLEPNGYALNVPLTGAPITVSLPSPVNLKVLPNDNNTTTPDTFLSWGGLCCAPDGFGQPVILGVRYSVRISLQGFSGVWDGAARNLLGPLVTPPFSSPIGLGLCIPDTGTQNNGIFLNNSGSGTTAQVYSRTDFQTAPLFQTATFENPPGTLDLNTIMQSAGLRVNFTATNLGFLLLSQDSITVNGVAMVGYGILILPQLVGYYVLNITGTDALSEIWATNPSSGVVTGTIDPSGDLFMKWNNSTDTIFISSAAVELPPLNPDLSFLRQRAWSYTLDGHTYYVLDLGAEGTFAYDITTQQWSNFKTSGFTQWDAANGVMWGNRVIAGDLLTSDVWEVAASATQDNGGTLDIPHVATGAIVTRNRDFHSVDDVRLAVSKGYYDEVLGSVMYLRYSDDGGTTWSDYLPHALTEGLTRGSLSWRSLGAFQAPGRVFEFSDSGGPFRIDGADVFIDNFDEDAPPSSQGEGT